ncbi:MAG: carbamoyltransferase HypF [Bacillota bacterium]|nr:carbamoyltransferase HypF [Bacillota bacterium]
MIRYSVKVKGIVQGVGFRPFVFRLAKSLSLCGFVRNTSEGVYIEIEGGNDDCEAFITKLKTNPPPLAHLEMVNLTKIPLAGEHDFLILSSDAGIRNTLISPDIGICDDCAADIAMKGNRRYRYAFTNCTNCGPRFTILKDIPYDRQNTTMADFPLCTDCREEYENPYDRRFHAQPNACHVCGPQLSFYQDGEIDSQDPYELFDRSIGLGQIVALKGIGGFHLACDAKNEEAVNRLRNKKLRYDKPFAVMMRDVETVQKYCELDDIEKEALSSSEKPIVLLKKKKDCLIAQSTTLSNTRLGVMLPYTPLHCLLMQEHEAIIMTSGNLSDCPMIFNDEEAFSKLFHVADAILAHNRQIFRRMDDSVCIIINEKTHMIRRARGYVPQPLYLCENNGVILAMGAQQKNTFCLAKGENAFLSGHIGDLDNEDTSKCLESEIESFIRIFDAEPEAIACDMHPDYVSTRYASRYRGKLPIFEIQHHHAHFASVLAEHQLREENAIGLIFDGTGYGTDGCIWGGESLFGNIKESTRTGHLLYFPLFSSEAAIREPWRIAIAVTDMAVGRETALSLFPDYINEAKILLQAGEKELNSPLTSSMGRLFDAVAALIGVRMHTTYEGQAAIELQQIMDESAKGSYHFQLTRENNSIIFDWRPLIREIISDLKSGIHKGTISLRFHRAVLELITSVAVSVQSKTTCGIVALSGGVFQNDFLLKNVVPKLEEKGFVVYLNERIPTNDGGISFGQAAAASYRMR